MIGQVLDQWAWRNDVRLHFIDPGKPTQNAFIESFSGRFRVVSRSWWKLGGAGTEGHGGMDQAARSRSVGKRSRVGQPSTRRMVI
jgi:transposase InsO family protein